MLARRQSPVSRSPGAMLRYVAACLAASVLCADIVGWGENLLGAPAVRMLGNVIMFNNMASALGLSPFMLAAVYPRVRARPDAVYRRDAGVSRADRQRRVAGS